MKGLIIIQGSCYFTRVRVFLFVVENFRTHNTNCQIPSWIINHSAFYGQVNICFQSLRNETSSNSSNKWNVKNRIRRCVVKITHVLRHYPLHLFYTQNASKQHRYKFIATLLNSYIHSVFSIQVFHFLSSVGYKPLQSICQLVYLVHPLSTFSVTYNILHYFPLVWFHSGMSWFF